MSVLLDPAELAAIADRIAAHAAATRDRAFRLDHAVSATGWTGLAASAFDHEARMVTDRLRNAAARLDTAADALRRHAARVSALLADLARLGADELELAKDAIFHPDQLVPDAIGIVGDGYHAVTDFAGGALDRIGL